MLHSIASTIWKTAKWLWLTIIIGVLINIAASFALGSVKDFSNTVLGSALKWLFLPGLNLTLTLAILISFTSITVAAWFIKTAEELKGIGLRRRDDRALKRYLHSVIDAYSSLSPSGLNQQQPLLEVSVPLDDVFIRLRVVPDLPIYDAPSEQLMLLETLRERPDLDSETREEVLQRLRKIWHSQLGQESAESQQNMAIEEVLGQLAPSSPVAIILGSPGSGKSTVLRWFALQMARASLSLNFHLPSGLSPQQIPILLKVSDYATQLQERDCTFEEFFTQHFTKSYPGLSDLPAKLLEELARGNCLILLDGLDEVANDSLHNRVAISISGFISAYSPESSTAPSYNRFLVTSRIVGYEGGPFVRYRHYTLLELEEKQIEQFLATWSLAVERYMSAYAHGMKLSTTQQESEAKLSASRQRDNLWGALQLSPDIKQLTLNPLMLTILCLLQRSGRSIPHNRIELYQVITRTLIDNWNRSSGRKVFSHEETMLVEVLLSNLAYKLHESDSSFLTEQEVKTVARQSIADFYQHPSSEVTDETIRQIIENIRSSSGLFLESGQGIFSFVHRTLQEYFVALYLLRMTPEALEQFVVSHYRLENWHEPVLNAIAYKSQQRDRDNRNQASQLIQAILFTDDPDSVFYPNLLFATTCVAVCNAWAIDYALQDAIANRLYDLYGDTYGTRRYEQLKEKIEKLALLWLQGQPSMTNQQDVLPPLLKVWRSATLGNSDRPEHQEGAICLLVTLAPSLGSCPRIVYQALVPPLLQLAHMTDLPCPPEISDQLSQLTTVSSSFKVEEYAFIALRLLDADGPSGWLHSFWLRWDEEKPELLERLTEHSFDLVFLMTVTAFPKKPDSQNWNKQRMLASEWQQDGRRNTRELQMRLLDAGDTSHFPLAYLLKQLLEQELTAPTSLHERPPSWRSVWDTLLREEMNRGRSATYQQCLGLRLLLRKGNEQQRILLANELVTALSRHDSQQLQAIITISNIYWRDLQEWGDLKELPDMRNISKMLEDSEISDLRYFQQLQALYYLLNLWDFSYLRYVLDLQDLLDRDVIVNILCDLLERQSNVSSSITLLALYRVIASASSISPSLKQQLESSIQEFVKQKSPLSVEVRILSNAILSRLKETAISLLTPTTTQAGDTPDSRASILLTLKQQRHLTKPQVEEILTACNDSRQLSEDKWRDIGTTTVRQIAWELLTQQFSLNLEALSTLEKALDSNDAMVCAVAALLMQRAKWLPQDTQQNVAQKIAKILDDDILSQRLLDSPDKSKNWRLDDILFETLEVLVN